jgi:hypothetical protein
VEPVAARVAGLTVTTDPAGEPSRILLGGSYLFGTLVGVALGVYGVVAGAAGPRPGGTLISLGLLLALVGNTGAALLVRWLTGTRLGALVVLIGWIPVVLALGSSRPEGDLLLRSSTTGYLFLAIGALGPLAVGVIGSPRRGLTAIPPPAARPAIRSSATGGTCGTRTVAPPAPQPPSAPAVPRTTKRRSAASGGSDRPPAADRPTRSGPESAAGGVGTAGGPRAAGRARRGGTGSSAASG